MTLCHLVKNHSTPIILIYYQHNFNGRQPVLDFQCQYSAIYLYVFQQYKLRGFGKKKWMYSKHLNYVFELLCKVDHGSQQ